ncbi:hypothetical protein A10D4_13607, partial [Idiomarina xiamenensis 10-D-4]
IKPSVLLGCKLRIADMMLMGRQTPTVKQTSTSIAVTAVYWQRARKKATFILPDNWSPMSTTTNSTTFTTTT